MKTMAPVEPKTRRGQRLNPDPKRFLDVKEGAYIVAMSAPALYARIKRAKANSNTPPFIRRGRRVLLPRDEFLKWAAQKVIE